MDPAVCKTVESRGNNISFVQTEEKNCTEQSFHLAEGIRLTVPQSISSMFPTPDDLLHLHNDLDSRRVTVKFLDEKKEEVQREENLDLREALETEVVTVLNHFTVEQVVEYWYHITYCLIYALEQKRC